MNSHYGTVEGGDAFFAKRLHSWDWEMSTPSDKLKSLFHSTMLIDQFRYTGERTEDEQELEFPRDGSDTVPWDIEKATYLIAQALLSGRNPDMDLEALSNNFVAYGGVRSSYTRRELPQHLTHLIPSPEAFNALLPYFYKEMGFILRRV